MRALREKCPNTDQQKDSVFGHFSRSGGHSVLLMQLQNLFSGFVRRIKIFLLCLTVTGVILGMKMELIFHAVFKIIYGTYDVIQKLEMKYLVYINNQITYYPSTNNCHFHLKCA